MTNEPSIQTIRKLFTRGWHFRVPVYQRAYAWERPEIETLIRDVVSSLDRPAYHVGSCLLYTSPSPRDVEESRMPSSA